MDARRYAYEYLLDKTPAGVIFAGGSTKQDMIDDLVENDFDEDELAWHNPYFG